MLTPASEISARRPTAYRSAEASRRGLSVEDLALETLEGRYGCLPAAGDALDAFIGSFDSGDPDWAGTDTSELRAQAGTRRPS